MIWIVYLSAQAIQDMSFPSVRYQDHKSEHDKYITIKKAIRIPETKYGRDKTF